ncbi:MAG: molybdopterin-dependent oxidoreductase [Solirubrobacterales bacterium]|nr:molybdopterin-dependent oxidoreductase [Solirubrobacterales bacterium]
MSERDPLHVALERGGDVVDPQEWSGRVPETYGVTPRVRFGSRWVSIWWALPISVVGLVILVAVAKGLRQTHGVQSFLTRYPGADVTSHPSATGFPWWTRAQHFFNLFFMLFIIRSGLQILADHPRLYFDRNSTPGRDWFRFQKPVPEDRVWTSKEDSVRLPGWLGIPGLRHSIGLARWWHFVFDLLWLINGVIFYVLVFATGYWQRIVPTSWRVFPNALSTTIQYLSLNWPQDHGWVAYNGLQLLGYFFTVFIAAPLALLTGLLQSPAISNRVRFAGRRFNHQLARTVHFWVLCWFLIFIFFHTTLVFTTQLLVNLNRITLGTNTSGWGGFGLYALWMAIVIAAWVAATPLTLRRPRLIQRVGRSIVGPFQNLFEHLDPRPGEYTEKDIAPHLWPNGKMPTQEQYEQVAANDFAAYHLRIFGEVEHPVELTLEQVKALPRQEQITAHHCIQGWSGVAKWAGVPMRDLCDLVKPRPEVQYVVFYSFVEGPDGGLYYDAHKLEQMYHRLTILAYELNGAPLGLVHGGPLRLRNEVELGYKHVKWVQAIEFVQSLAHLGGRYGGYDADHEFFGYRAAI